MSSKRFLVLMTAIAVVSDSMLHPFYPQYFAAVFGVTDPRSVAHYIAACSLTVLLTFPLWALVARRVAVLPLLIATQVGAGILSLACALTSSLTWFWVTSLGVMVFKASYLLIYPYVMSLEDREHHVGTISLLAFVVYFGNILAALLSGVMLQLIDPRVLFLAMACGDVLQVWLCLHLHRTQPASSELATTGHATATSSTQPRFFLAKLGAVMLALYFSAYVTEPFFSTFWEHGSGIDNKIVTGFVFAIPGLAALAGLYANARATHDGDAYAGILSAIALAIGSLALQAYGSQTALLLGRFGYGWALFQAMVRLDALLFRFSTPDTYAVEFSKANLFQGLGVLFASLTAGGVVSWFGTRATFAFAGGGFALGFLLLCVLFRNELWPESDASDPHAESTGVAT